MISAQTQCDRLLRHFMAGNSITTAQAIPALHIGDVRARIKDLRQSGVVVSDKPHRSEQGGTYKRWYLTPSEIARLEARKAARERGAA